MVLKIIFRGAPANDLAAFNESFHIKAQYPKLGQALLSSMQRHAWYLTEQLILFALTDEDIEDEKKKILEKPIKAQQPESFQQGKPVLPVINIYTQLLDLVGSQSWILIKFAGIEPDEVDRTSSHLQCLKTSFRERNIKLVPEFLMGYKNEDEKR